MLYSGGRTHHIHFGGLHNTHTVYAAPFPTPPPPPAPLPPVCSPDEPNMCYICFEDTSTEGNELVPSPCTCRKSVHRQCLSKWIATKGSRLCSICKTRLPIDFTVAPPFLVLQVVRHMRGLHWQGEREYVISFSSATSVVIGSGNECDVTLPDPSLSKNHSRLEFKNEGFQVCVYMCVCAIVGVSG
jgi:hypothetical protein